MSETIVSIDTIRTVAEASIAATYSPVGTPLTVPARIVSFINATDGDMFFSDDGVNDKLFFPAGTFKIFDLNTNRKSNIPEWVFRVGTQFFVRYSTAPTKSAVYIEVLTGG